MRWVCPNCNQQLETTGSRNHATYKKNFCIDCGKEIALVSIRCKSCEAKHRITDLDAVVDRETLKHLIRTTPFTQIGKHYGVSDNAVRRWCIKHNLPSRVKDIKKYSDEEWLTI